MTGEEMDIEYYSWIENYYIRKIYGVYDSTKMDSMVQMLIDKGEVNKPHVMKMVDGRPEIEYITYSEFKEMVKDGDSALTFSLDELFKEDTSHHPSGLDSLKFK